MVRRAALEIGQKKNGGLKAAVSFEIRFALQFAIRTLR
jgi:hypothetical protein